MSSSNEIISDNYDYEDEIKKEIIALSNVSNDLQSKKEKILNKIIDSIDKMSLDLDNEKPKNIEAKNAIINSSISLMDSIEKQKRDTLKFKANYDAIQKSNDDMAKLITSILNRIDLDKSDNKLKTIVESLDNVDENIKEELTNNNIEINDEEISLDESKEDVDKVLNKYNLTK